MREVTVQELVKVFDGQLVKIEAPEHYGISIDMDKASIDYHEDDNELSFTAGNYNHDGIGTVSVDVDECIESIQLDDNEDEPVYTITFTGYMSDIMITRFKSIEELEADHKQTMLKN
ncbi:hypothetical protein ACTNEW_03705 [Blautia sp. HCP3S3_G3]|uniref:hypothetical protein n=1 Tax=Blautia sp. HCP3S3_G3 TaxID=3438913 RepID=UPI003F8AFE1F